jgi:uncharacterized protein YceH (UPF0502 family)
MTQNNHFSFFQMVVFMTTSDQAADSSQPPKPLSQRQRRILGVLMEKARTTPDAYPLTLNGLVTGCNQKSNRHPLMDLTSEQVEDELEKMRAAGLVAEVQGSGRVPKYRHFGYDYMHVKGAEAAIMTELLLRGEQTAGELRTRASRFENIADLHTLQSLLDSLMARGLVVAITPAGRGQLLTHNLYLPEELSRLKQLAGNRQPAISHSTDDEFETPKSQAHTPSVSSVAASSLTNQPAWDSELAQLREELADLRNEVEKLRDRLDRLES